MSRLKLVQKQKNRLNLAYMGKVGGGIAACAYAAVMMVGNIGKTTDTHANTMDEKTEIVYFENFDGYMNGATESTLWDIGGAQSVRTSEDYFFEVRKGEFLARAVGKEKTWTTAEIDIAHLQDVSVTVDLVEKGKMESSDYIHVLFQLDEGEAIHLGQNGKMDGEFNKALALEEYINGETLQVIVRVKNNEFNELHIFDNISVSGMEKQVENIEASLK